MKKIVSVLLVIVISVSVFSACSADKPKKKPQKASTGNHTLYFRDKSKSEKVTATFFNSANEKKTTVKMVKIDEDKDSRTFSCKGDTTAYNMAYITYDGMRTSKFAFNKCVSGWNNDEKGFMPYVYGENPTYKYKYKDVTLKFIGYDKIIHIWTPEGYDASSKEKYSTLYLLDGHAVDFIEQPIGHTVAESDNATEQVKSMMKLTGNKVIQVAVETDGDTVDNTRDDELIPNLGKMAHEEGTSKKNGSKFADFMNDTVVPYIQKHYNVYKDARHTAIEGTSLSALEAFYVAMKYPKKFGTAGVLSPSFWTYKDSQWRKFLKTTSFGKNAPYLYIYSGGERGDTGKEATQMVERLKDMKYPKNKLVYHYNERGTHDVPSWRSIFAEFLEAMAYHHVEVLQK